VRTAPLSHEDAPAYPLRTHTLDVATVLECDLQQAGDMVRVRAEGGLVAAEVEADSVFRVLRRETLFDASGYFLAAGTDLLDIGPDDERFLMLRAAGLVGETGGAGRFILVMNWSEVLRERLGN